MLGKLLLFVLFLAFGVVPLMTWFEERRHFKSISFFRTIIVVQAWILLATIEAVRFAILKYFFQQDVRMRAHKSCGTIARGILHVFFDGFEILGKENMSQNKEDVPMVIIANHQSMLDVAAIFSLDLKAAWVAKTTVFMMPGVGWLMYLAGYVPVERKNSGSIKRMYEQCKQVAREGWSLILFPQGTRSRYEFLPFKNGAYNLAGELEMPMLPVSIFIPADVWAKGTKIRVEVHKIVNGCNEENKDDIRQATFETIKTGLLKLQSDGDEHVKNQDGTEETDTLIHDKKSETLNIRNRSPNGTKKS